MSHRTKQLFMWENYRFYHFRTDETSRQLSCALDAIETWSFYWSTA